VLDFNRNVHTSGEIELFQFVHGLGGGVKDINEPFVRALLESFLRFFIRVGRALHGKALDTGRERDWPGDASAGAFNGIRDFAGGLVNDPMVKSLKPNSYALCSHTKNNYLLMVYSIRFDFSKRALSLSA